MEEPLAQSLDDPLEEIGQTLTLPTFRRMFKKIVLHEVDSLRVLFVAQRFGRPCFCNRWVLGPLLALNSVMRRIVPSFERGIVAHLEDLESAVTDRAIYYRS